MSSKQNVGGFYNPKSSNNYMRMNTNALNELSYYHHRKILSELAITRFRWVGLPETVDTRFLEKTLTLDGVAVILLDPYTNEWKACRVQLSQVFDEQERYSDYIAYGTPNYRVKCSVDGDGGETGQHGVLVFDNVSRENLTPIIDLFARRMTDCDRASDTQVANQKNPLVFSAPSEQKNTLLQQWRQAENNEPVILKTSEFNDSVSTDLMNTGIPFTGLDLKQYKNILLKEFKDMIGVETSPIDRVNVAQVSLVDEESDLMRLSYLKARRDSLDWLREHGIDAGVFWNRDDESVAYSAMMNMETAHDLDLIHNDSRIGERNPAVKNVEDNNG